MSDSQLEVIRHKIEALKASITPIRAKIKALETILDKHYVLVQVESDCNGHWKRHTFVRIDIGNQKSSLAPVVDELIADQMVDLVEYKNGIQYLTITDKGKQYRRELEQEVILE